MYVCTIASEYWMRFHLDVHYQITCCTPVTCVSLLWYFKIDAIIDAFWYVNPFCNLACLSAFTTTRNTWVSIDWASSITVAADLLDYERTLSNCLESLALTPTASRWFSTWLCFRTITRATDVCPVVLDCSWTAFNCLHKAKFKIDRDVWASSFHLASAAWLSASAASEHFLEFFENIPKSSTLWSSSSLSELLLEAFKTSETPTKRTSRPKRSLPAKWILSLFITCHASLVVNSSLLVITQRLICVVDRCKLFFRFWCFVDIRMVLLGQFEVCFLNFVLRRIFRNSKLLVKILLAQ